MKNGLKRTAENSACPPLFKVRDLVPTLAEARRNGWEGPSNLVTVGGLLLTEGAVATFLWLSRSKANERWIRSKPSFRNFSSRVFELAHATGRNGRRDSLSSSASITFDHGENSVTPSSM